MKLVKLLSLAILLSLLFPVQSEAQWWVGGRIGGTSASITGTNLPSFQPTPKMYLNGGFATSFAFSRRFNIHMELLYSGKGSAIQYRGEFGDFDEGTVAFDERLHYFALPVMLQFKLGDRDNYFHFDGGIVFNRLIGHKFEGTTTIMDSNNDKIVYQLDSPYLPSNSDFSYAIGVGLVANGVTFDFRYEVGLNEIFQAAPGAPKIYNRAFLVSVGYMVNLM
jgi:hypothetical protein